MLGLRTVIYKVGDIESAKQWYTKAFRIAPYFDQPFYVGFNIGGYELGLDPNGNSTGNKTENVLAYWGVADIQIEFDRLISLGATSYEPPANVGGEIMVATVKDPWGNVVGMIYNPLFKIQ